MQGTLSFLLNVVVGHSWVLSGKLIGWGWELKGSLHLLCGKQILSKVVQERGKLATWFFESVFVVSTVKKSQIEDIFKAITPM